MLPILHLNGYKIAGPTVLARIRERSSTRCSRVTVIARSWRAAMTCENACTLMAAALDQALAEIAAIQAVARRAGGRAGRAGR